jgi:hypothetical protein
LLKPDELARAEKLVSDFQPMGHTKQEARLEN